jgi:hypothetical protein
MEKHPLQLLLWIQGVKLSNTLISRQKKSEWDAGFPDPETVQLARFRLLLRSNGG